jgi:hypothetical protein
MAVVIQHKRDLTVSGPLRAKRLDLFGDLLDSLIATVTSRDPRC